ncbi:hypothetical protein AURDEDRAFT_141196 [Auricularia subglabra TFB-10046 SS5]|nr:hypothetical protein AURDEDRAFT_141196 [Auricularia subglabra TFB-10046 SS5]
MTCGAPLDTLSCKVLLGFMIVFAFFSIGLADGLVTMEVWQLWGCERSVLQHMQVAFAITYSGSAAFLLYSYVFVLRTNFKFLPFGFNVCQIGQPPRLLTGTWACGLVFELAVFFSTLWNVLSTPRSGNARITAMLYRDGSLYFAGVMALRFTNMMTALFSSPESFFTFTFPTWALVTILVNRLVMNQSRERLHLRENVQMAEDLGAPRAALPVRITRTAAQDYEMGRVRVETALETYSDLDQEGKKASLAAHGYDGILGSALI